MVTGVIASNMQDRKADEPVALNIRSIPFSLRRRFKVWCAQRSMTMEEAVINMIEETLAPFEQTAGPKC